jgi:hypothetical protein
LSTKFADFTAVIFAMSFKISPFKLTFTAKCVKPGLPIGFGKKPGHFDFF